MSEEENVSIFDDDDDELEPTLEDTIICNVETCGSLYDVHSVEGEIFKVTLPTAEAASRLIPEVIHIGSTVRIAQLGKALNVSGTVEQFKHPDHSEQSKFIGVRLKHVTKDPFRWVGPMQIEIED